MIIEYIRPKTIKEAVKLISRDAPVTIPMGGGTSLKGRSARQDFSVVDLQALKLDAIITEQRLDRNRCDGNLANDC